MNMKYEVNMHVGGYEHNTEACTWSLCAVFEFDFIHQN